MFLVKPNSGVVFVASQELNQHPSKFTSPAMLPNFFLDVVSQRNSESFVQQLK